MSSRTRPILAGLGSTLLLAVLLVGPPIALAMLVGWPLPTSIPDSDSLNLAIQSGISDEVVVKGLAIVAWVAWSQIALAIVVEAIAVICRTKASKAPVVPGIQAAAGRLVASVALMIATISPTAASAATSPPPIVSFALSPPIEAPVLASTVAEPLIDAAPAAPTPAAPAPRPTVRVERHDSYWAIAERTLGDGRRWNEIRDLNIGKTMNTGDVIQPASELVLMGWVLELPGDAPTVGATTESTPASVEDIVVEPGDNFWTLAEEELAEVTGADPTVVETAPYWQDLVGANTDRLVEPGNPNLILPGQHLIAPPVPGFEPQGGRVASVSPPDPASGVPPASEDSSTAQAAPGNSTEAPPRTATPAPSTAETAPPPSIAAPTVGEAPTSVPASSSPNPVGAASLFDEADQSSDAPPPAITFGIASAALAVGVTSAIRRRRRRSAHRHPRSASPLPTEPAQAAHRQLAAAADEEGVEQLRDALGDLARALAASGAATRPRVVQHALDHLDLFVDNPCPPPDGWRSIADDVLWTLESKHLRRSDADPICAAPLLVTLGRPDDDGQLYLDLEAEGFVSLVGDHEVARSVVRAMLVELAFTPLADCLEVLVVGDLAPPEIARLDHVTVAADWTDVADDLARWAVQSHAAIEDRGWPNTFVARGEDPYHDAVTPIVVMAGQAPPDDLLTHFRANSRSTLTVVATDAMEGATTIECDAEQLTVVDLGLGCTPYPMDMESLDVLIDLVNDEDDDDEEGIDLGDEIQLSLLPPELFIEPDLDADGADTVEPDYDVLVRVLGDIRIEGGDRLGPKHTAMVAYVVLNGTVSADKLEDALWTSPVTSGRRKRLNNTMSDCRAALGRHYLPPSSDGRYTSGPGIVTDLQLFDCRVQRATGQRPADAADTLLSALELVTGPLFNYRKADGDSYAWVEVENWISTWELKVSAVAQRCTDLLLDQGRAAEAVDASLQALAIMPTHSGLTESLMRAHAANGDRTAVRRVYEEHLSALDALDLDEVDDSTRSLYQRLTISSVR
jgi:DNA-binding SARP family transcriptional activator